MAEYIEKQAVIDVIDEYDFEFPNYMERFVTELRDAMKADIKHDIEALPSAQPEQRWISVSEKLPEDEYVLISKKPTKLSGSKWSVGIGIRTADPRSGKIQWRDSGFGIIQDDKVLAWRPLPEPYEAEEES